MIKTINLLSISVKDILNYLKPFTGRVILPFILLILHTIDIDEHGHNWENNVTDEELERVFLVEEAKRLLSLKEVTHYKLDKTGYGMAYYGNLLRYVAGRVNIDKFPFCRDEDLIREVKELFEHLMGV